MAVLDLGKVVPEKGTDYFTEADIEEIVEDVKTEISVPTKTSDLTNDSGFIDNTVNNLTNYELKTNTGSTIALSIDSSTYVMTMSLKNSAGTILNTQTVDLPLETMVVGGSYDSTNKKIVLTLKNESTIDVPVGDLVSGLQAEITSSNKLASDLVEDTNNTNKFVTASEKTTWNGKQDALTAGTNITIQNNVISANVPTIDLSNYLAKDNTTSYTPTGDYNPATKKYVDDNAGSEEVTEYVWDVNTSNYYLNGASKNITDTTALADLKTILNKILAGGEFHQKFDKICITNGTSVVINAYETIPYKSSIYQATTSVDPYPEINFVCPLYKQSPSSSDKQYSALLLTIRTQMNAERTEFTAINYCNIATKGFTLTDTSEVLTTTNTTSFTPSGDYQPATKKYVDDAIASAITTTLGGNY